MVDPERLFTHELEVFRTETQAGTQFLYAFFAINAVLGENRKALNAANKTPLFWKTNIGALKTAFFIVLGRIFDQKSKHNVDSLLRIAQDNIGIFSKATLAERKRRITANSNAWLDDYLKQVYEPTQDDFRRLRKYVNRYRKIYEENYRDIRHGLYAHKGVSEDTAVKGLFKKTNIRELEKIFTFLNALRESLWELLNNGEKPVLRPMRYSMRSIIKNRQPVWKIQTVQERIVGETQDFFQALTFSVQEGSSAGTKRRRG